MRTSDFYYELPQELIAQDPLEDRSSSRLMHLSMEDGSIEHRHFRDILDYLKEGDTLVINDTKVIPARLFGVKEDTQAKIDEVKAQLDKGTIHVFDTSTFTVTVSADKNKNAKVDANGKLTSYMADVDTDANFTGDTEAVKDGYFHESEFRSAPYFDVQIDGINLLNAKF